MFKTTSESIDGIPIDGGYFRLKLDPIDTERIALALERIAASLEPLAAQARTERILQLVTPRFELDSHRRHGRMSEVADILAAWPELAKERV